MVNWQDPATQLYSAHVAVFLTNVSTGVYLWEFSIAFAFDWQYFSRQRPFRWTLIPYFVARYACAFAFILYIYPSNIFHPTNSCGAWWKVLYAFAHTGMGASSLLLVIRVIAIAEKNRWIMVVLGCLWLAETGTSIHSSATIEGVYIPQMLACGPTNTIVSRPYMLISFALHFACLAIVMFLLLRSRGAEFWSLLLSQGIVYFAVSMVAHVSTSVLLLLNLNDGMNLSMQVPSVVALGICATRMYRGLVMYNQRVNTDAFTMTISNLQAPAARSARDARVSIVMPRGFNTYSTTDEDLQLASRQESDATKLSGGQESKEVLPV